MSDVVTERLTPKRPWATGASLDAADPSLAEVDEALTRELRRLRKAGIGVPGGLVDSSPPPSIEREADWHRFLSDLTGPPFRLSERHAKALRDLWTYLRIAIGPRLSLPQVDATEEGSIKLCWSRPQYYAEIELHREDGEGRCRHEWFFRDRVDDTHDGSTEPESGAPALRFLGLLQRATGG